MKKISISGQNAIIQKKHWRKKMSHGFLTVTLCLYVILNGCVFDVKNTYKISKIH